MNDPPNLPGTAFVLDDEARVGAVVCKMLTMIGVGSHSFTGATEFLSEVEHAKPDLVILDLALGQTDAVEIIRQLERLSFTGKVLLISGRHGGALNEIGRIGRAHGLRILPPLEKPFRAADLRSALQATADASPEVKLETPRSEASKFAPRLDLKQALRLNWLEIWFQPKVDIKSLRVCGAEALIRARHPDQGIVAPRDFLPRAGDAAYKPLSIFVLRQSVAAWRVLAEAGFPLKLAINLPASLLNEPGFVSVVRQTIPTDPEFPGLMIEITEDEMISDPNGIREVAAQLRLCNAFISIDDFGTAYASLSRLIDLPFSELKLDRIFVADCSSDDLKSALCQTVSDLAHRFGASACAEGVETMAELRCLAAHGFDTAQGYLFAKPMPLDHFVPFLQDPKRQWDGFLRDPPNPAYGKSRTTG